MRKFTYKFRLTPFLYPHKVWYLNLFLEFNMHPSHEDQLLRLKKVEGQVRGIQNMIEERRYCMDLLSQIKAVTGALRKIESGILENHLQHCVNDAIKSKNKKNAELKIKEITKLFEKMT